MRARLSSNDAQMMRMPVLIPEESRPGLSAVVLNRAICVVGARARVHLPLSAKEVSKAHALIVNDRDCVYLRDLSSRNHTYVNDSPVREMPLDDEDVIKFGQVVFRCQLGFRKDSAMPALPATPAGLAIDGQGQVPIDQRTLVIGSRSDCEVTLPGEDVSPAHAVIFERNGERFLRDLDSISGTRLNGTTVRERQLKLGDKIEIAGVEIQYQAAGAPVEDEPIGEVSEMEPIPLADAEDEALKVWDSGLSDEDQNIAVAEHEPVYQMEEPAEPAEEISLAPSPSEEVPVETVQEEQSAAPQPIPIEAVDEPIDIANKSSNVISTEPAELAVEEIPVAEVSPEPISSDLNSDIPSEQPETIAEESGASDRPAEFSDDSGEPHCHVSTREISRLVGEVTEKAHELESAWQEFESSADPDGPHPGTEQAKKSEEDSPRPHRSATHHSAQL